MHKTAEYGIAAHWKYKENITGDGDNEEQKIAWLRQILEWQRDMSDNHEFINLLKDDLNMFSERVYCFTPNGDVKNLPSGSTPIDFAYSIHSAVGNKMVGARVNGKMVNIDYKLQNGDRVEIITSNNSTGPSRDWLKVVQSTQAKNKINVWFKQQNKEENIVKGKELIEKYCKAKNINLSEILKPAYMEKVRLKYSYKEWDSLIASIGHGGLKEGQIVNKLLDEYEKEHKVEVTDDGVLKDTNNNKANVPRKSNSKSGIIVEGMDDVAVRFSKCCSPVPGDEIVGFVTRGRGVSIHRTDCINIMNLPDIERGRLIEASWAADEGKQDGKYMTEIVIYANNRVGILTDLSRIFTERNIDVNSINSRTSKSDIATIAMTFAIQGTLWQLTKLEESALTPSVHQGSVVGLIEPLRAFGSGSVLSLICQVAQCVLINNNCLPLFKLFLKLTFFSLRVFSINYFLANFPISSYFYIISLSRFNL